MPTLNRVVLLGNVTRDLELRHTPQGTAVCSLGLAVNRRITTAAGEQREETCFVDIDVWGKQAESCANYLRKGSPALVEGHLRMDQWDDRETGKRRTRLRVHADRVQFLGPPSGGEFAVGGSPARAEEAGQDGARAPSEAAPMPAFEPLPADESSPPDGIPF